jgi:uncharacterized membrane protein YecN with MAPEG domain
VPAPITGLYAALCGLLVVALAGRVIAIRRATKVGIGDGADRRLARAVRGHAHAVAELGGAGAGLLHGCGIALVVGRIAHALGFTRTAGISFGRTLGVTLTFGVILVLAAVDAASFVR